MFYAIYIQTGYTNLVPLGKFFHFSERMLLFNKSLLSGGSLVV